MRVWAFQELVDLPDRGPMRRRQRWMARDLFETGEAAGEHFRKWLHATVEGALTGAKFDSDEEAIKAGDAVAAEFRRRHRVIDMEVNLESDIR